jgi:hypothetical protein
MLCCFGQHPQRGGKAKDSTDATTRQAVSVVFGPAPCWCSQSFLSRWEALVRAASDSQIAQACSARIGTNHQAVIQLGANATNETAPHANAGHQPLCFHPADRIASGEGRGLVNQAYDDLLAMTVVSEGVQNVPFDPSLSAATTGFSLEAHQQVKLQPPSYPLCSLADPAESIPVNTWKM